MPADVDSTPNPTTDTETRTMTTPTGGRLASGELRRMVAGWLADHPGTDVTAREIAADLGRSSGAVGNALRTLVDQGTAEQAGTAPLRFRANDATRSTDAPTARPAPATTPKKSAPAKPAKAKTAPKKENPGPVTRPNGQSYHPRKLAGLPDVTALRKLRDAGIPALMYGPPGTGKTSVIEAAFPDLITVPGDGDTTVADFVGEYTQTPEGRYVFVHGPLVTAMRKGRCLFIDDATLIPPTVLAVVYPAMDGRREITVKANGGETVTAATGFYTVAGHNPGVHGAVLTDALASRFSAQIQVSTDFDLAAQLKIDSRAVRVARNLATRQRTGDVTWAPQLRELIAFQKIAEVLGTDAAARNLIGIAPEDDREAVAKLVRDLFKVSAEPLSLGSRI